MIFVLYVDEESPLEDTARSFLERGGDILIETSYSVEEAMRKMEYISFDAIVTNYISRESAGIALLRNIRQKGNMVPFVFFRIGQNLIPEDDLIRYGRVALVPKIPDSYFNLDGLETTIRSIISAAHSESPIRQ